MRELSMHEIQQVSGGHGEVLSNQSQSAGMFSHHGNRYGGYFDYFGTHPDEERPGEMPPDIPYPEEEEREEEERSCGDAILNGAVHGLYEAAAALFIAVGIFKVPVPPNAAAALLAIGAADGAYDAYESDPSCNDEDDD